MTGTCGAGGGLGPTVRPRGTYIHKPRHIASAGEEDARLGPFGILGANNLPLLLNQQRQFGLTEEPDPPLRVGDGLIKV